MKILYLRLKGYGGIYQGMGRDQIEIDFTKFSNNIILIQGQNGCGKSTILESASMEIDGSEFYRTDILYKNTPQGLIQERIEYPAEKEIHIQDGDDIYVALILSHLKADGKRGVTKAFFSRNGEELNPNGNVSSYKDIKNTILEIDPNYTALCLISGEKRGLVDKTPADRKRFMSSVIDTLDFYNNCYKNLSKKSGVIRSNINNMKSKIFNIGDPDNLLATLSISQTRLIDLEQQRIALIEKIAEANATIKILDPNGEIQTLYQSIIDNLDTINLNISKYSSTLDTLLIKFSKSYQNDVSIEKQNLEKVYNTTINTIQINKNTLSFKIQSRNDIQSKLEDSKSKLSTIQSSDIRTDIESVVDDIKDELELCEVMFKSSDMDISISKQEWIGCKTVLENIKSMIVKIWDNQSDDIKTSSEFYINQTSPIAKKQELQNEIYNINMQLSTNMKRMIEVDNILDIVSILDKRPSACTIDTCPFIEQAIQYNKNDVLNEKATLMQDIEQANLLLEDMNKKILSNGKIVEVYNDIRNLIMYISSNNYILSRIGNISENIINPEVLIKRILSHHNFNEFLTIDERINMVDIVENYKKKKENIIKLEADLAIYKNNKTISDSLQSDIEKLNHELASIDIEIGTLNNSIKFDTSLIESMKRDMELMDDIILKSNELNVYKENKRELGEKFKQVRDSIANVKEKVDIVETSKQALALLDNEYNPLKDSIDKIKFSLDKLESYRVDLQNLEERFEKIEFLKKACSPSSGIQHLYISMYMSQTIKIANDLLRLMFNGNIQMLTPVIDETEFRIPFQNVNGITIDIASGSTSQRCMFGTTLGFALTSQGSEKANIMRLDEVDGGLDTENTMGFTGVIRNTMDLLNIEQCLMISHKIEAETYGADIIYVSKNGLSFSC